MHANWLRSYLVLAAIAFTVWCRPGVAQQGAVVGRVVNATTLAPVPGATIRVVGGGPASEVRSESDGSFELRLDPGLYDFLVEASDFAAARFDRIPVYAGLNTTRNLPLESQGYRLAGFIVTASRGSLETEITAPSSSHSVRRQEIIERPAPSPVEHLRSSPGVDIGTLGLQSSNVVVRGFNNIFSGALHLLSDYRLVAVPALRVNYLHFLASSDDDVERIEVVLGPGSALYGPNTANGVVHLIQRSPFEDPGTTVSLGVGERSTAGATFRSAHPVTDRFAVKLSGHFYRGREWPHVDSTEAQAALDADADFPGCVADRELRGLSAGEAEAACQRIGMRDDGLRRYGLEARADWRFSRRGTLVGSYGVSGVSGIELTGLGAARIEDWLTQFVQGRFTYDRWAIQGYVNFNDAGDAFLLRDGMPLFDRSKLSVLQLQNGFSFAQGRQDFTYGLDYFSTRPVSRGTIYGDFEGDNSIREWGLYLQSRTALSSWADLIAAGRVDSHSILPDRVFSPRLALVLQPSDDHAFRMAYNRAFSTPTALNHFLDLGAGFASGDLGELGYSTRAFGTGRDGVVWQNLDGSLKGMRSPFNPDGAGQLLPVDQATLWQMGLEATREASPLPPDVLAVLQGLQPEESDVDIMYLDVNSGAAALTPVSALRLPDLPPLRETSTESVEAGWTGVFANTVRVSLDVYYRKLNDFVSPLVVETPLLFLDGAGLEEWLGAAYVPARVDDLVERLGLDVEAARAEATAEAAALVPGLATGLGQLPLGVTSSDVPQMANGGADLIASYRNVGDLDLWGADATLQWLLSDRWTLSGTYSHVSENWFPVQGSSPIALNAPSNKATVGIAYRDAARGLSGTARVRYTGAYPFLSTEFAGTRCIPDAPTTDFQEDCIHDYALVDLTLAYRLPGTAATVQVGVTNLLNTRYRSFVGAPETGRLAMLRVRYRLF